MSTDNNTGIQMRAMAEAQCMENEANPEQVQGTPKPAMNPTVDLHRTKEEVIKEFIRQQGTIALDWYIPDFHNTRVGNLIKERLPIETMEGRISFSCPPLSEFFKISFRVGSQDKTSIHIPCPTGEHRCLMSARTVQSRTISKLTTR